MNRYLVGTYVLGADDVAQSIVADRALQSQKAKEAADDKSDFNMLISIAIAGAIAVVAWPWAKRNV